MRRALCGVAVAVLLSVGLSSCGSDDGDKKVLDPGAGGERGGSTHESGGAPPQDEGGTGGTAGTTNLAGTPSAGAGGAAETPCVLGDLWELVDDFTLTPGTNSNVGNVAADTAGNVYAAGVGSDDQNMSVGVLRRSLDSGATWGDSGWEGALPNDLAADSAGNLFVAAGSSTGSVYKSSDQGMSFDSVFDIPTTPEPNIACSSGFVGTGDDGVVVAGGSCDDDGWTVHKSRDGGENWEPAFTFLLAPGKASRLHDVAVGPDGAAYASGYGVDENDQIHWLVVREGMPDGVLSDQFQLEDGLAARAFGFASGGQLVVAGAADDADGSHGVVRRMSAPDTWETLDTFDTRAVDVEVSGDTVIAVGQLEVPVNVSIARRSDDGGETWGDSVPYDYIAGQLSFSGRLSVDGRGSFYRVVAARDQDMLSRWIVLKLGCE